MDKTRAKSSLATTAAMGCLKTLLIVFNFIFWVTGIAILALGIWTKVQLYKYMELSSVYYKESPYILIVMGILIVLVGSLGCCCTIRGNNYLLYLYAVFLMVIFAVELSAGIAGFIYKSKLQDGFKEGLNNALNKYSKDTEISEGMDDLQKQLKCCGVVSYSDWRNSTYKNIPKSCCIHTCERDLSFDTANVTQQIYQEGCYKLVVDFMDGNMATIAGVALGISFLQVLGAVLAFCLAKNIGKSKYEQVA